MNTLSKTLLALAALCTAGLPSPAKDASPAPNSITVRIAPLPGAKALPPDAMSYTISVLSRRAASLGITDIKSRVDGKTLTVTLHNLQGTVAKRRRNLAYLATPARLELIWLKDVRTKDRAGNPKGRYVYEGASSVRDSRTRKILTPAELRSRVLYADPKCTIVSGADLKPNGAQVDLRSGAEGRRVVTMLRFNDAGTRRFADFTQKHIGSLLAIVLNGTIQSAPRILSRITDGVAVIDGSATTVKEAQELANLLNAGALPVALTIVRMDRQE